MKNIFLHIISILILSTLTAQAQNKVIGNGNIITQNRTVSSFDAIEVSDGWDIILTQNGKHALKIESHENFMEHVVTEVVGGTLKIYATNRLSINWKNDRQHRKKIYVSFVNLKSIRASGGSDVEATQVIQAKDLSINLSGGSDLERFILKANSLNGKLSGGSDVSIAFETIQKINLVASGGSDLVLRDISGNACKLDISSGSDAILSGEVTNLEITASGGSDIDSHSLKVNDCTLALSGSSDAYMEVQGKLDISLSGGSDVSLRGSPQIVRKDICKSCDLSVR